MASACLVQARESTDAFNTLQRNMSNALADKGHSHWYHLFAQLEAA